jgi:hypothetical protein
VSARRSWLGFAVTAAIGAVVLLTLGFSHERSRAFSLEAPNVQPVAVLAPHTEACEGPIMTPHPVDGVRVWGAAAGRSTALDVLTQSTSGKLLATGRIVVSTQPNAYTSVLTSSIPSGQATTVCLFNGGSSPFSLLGSPSQNPAIRMTVGGRTSPLQFSLVLLRPPTPLLSLLPTAFSRASLFRPGWVGAWTFWALLAGLVLAVVLAGLAISAAARADARERTGS